MDGSIDQYMMIIKLIVILNLIVTFCCLRIILSTINVKVMYGINFSWVMLTLLFEI